MESFHDNPIVVPFVNTEVSVVESANSQFRYETKEKLIEELDKEYHQV